MIIYKEGVAPQTSINLWKIRSIQPPKKPWIAPAAIPIIEEISVTTIAKKTDNLKPYIILAKTSLEVSSVPSQCFWSGGDGAARSRSFIVLYEYGIGAQRIQFLLKFSELLSISIITSSG